MKLPVNNFKKNNKKDKNQPQPVAEAPLVEEIQQNIC